MLTYESQNSTSDGILLQELNLSDHNGRLVVPSIYDREIINILLVDAIVPVRELVEEYIKLITIQHLFLETEMVNLKWILAHLQEVEKELKRLKERVKDASS